MTFKCSCPACTRTRKYKAAIAKIKNQVTDMTPSELEVAMEEDPEKLSQISAIINANRGLLDDDQSESLENYLKGDFQVSKSQFWKRTLVGVFDFIRGAAYLLGFGAVVALILFGSKYALESAAVAMGGKPSDGIALLVAAILLLAVTMVCYSIGREVREARDSENKESAEPRVLK